MTGRRPALALAYLGLTYLFGGRYGLVIGCLVVAGAVGLRLTPRAYWAGALLALAAAPFALVFQGLPTSRVVGPGFAQAHLAAHVLTGIALALAGWAALSELVLGEEAGSTRASRLGLLIRSLVWRSRELGLVAMPPPRPDEPNGSGNGGPHQPTT